jgi:hypothetical protein
MTLADINRRIQLEEPTVTLIRGEGYCYFIYDVAGKFETESLMIPYLNMLPAAEWIARAVAFGRKMSTPE